MQLKNYVSETSQKKAQALLPTVVSMIDKLG